MEHAQRHQTAKGSRFMSCWIGWIVPLVLLIAMPMNARSQTVHALLVIMDADLHLGTAMKANLLKVENLLTTIDEAGKFRVKTETLLSSRNTARKSSITEWLETIQPGDNDVIFVYFSGQGRFQRQAGEEIVFLQDGGIRQSDFAQQVQNTGTCRLKILITDRCNHIFASASGESQQRNNLLSGKELFQNHEGFLHLTSAAANEFGWAEENDGGLFTAALARAIGSEPDTHGNRIVSWQKIFDETRGATGKQFERARPMLPEATKEILRRQGIESQTPTAYALPTRLETPPPTNPNELWELMNPDARFSVSLQTEKTDYRLNDYLTLNVKVTDDAHLIILNRDNAGHLTLLFPNRYHHDNWLRGNENYTFPDQASDFDFRLAGPPGTECFKLIALRHAQDSQTILALILSGEETFNTAEGQQRKETEEKIATYLRRIKKSDWAEATRSIEIRQAGESDRGPAPEELSDVTRENIVYIEHEGYMYFAQLTDPDNADTETVAVHIFNEELRGKLGQTLPAERVLDKRTEPEEGWGNRHVRLNFYRDGEWHLTFEAVVFETYYLLPEHIDGKRVQGPRKVGLGEVRIAIPVSYQESEPPTQKF